MAIIIPNQNLSDDERFKWAFYGDRYIDGTNAKDSGHLITESYADKKLLIKRIGVSIGLAFCLWIISNISSKLFLICFIAYVLFEMVYIGNLHDFWEKTTYAAVYENYFLYAHDEACRINYNVITKIELVEHCIRVYTPTDYYSFYFLENEEYLYYCLRIQIEKKTGRML